MAFCIKCGSELKGNSTFCGKCGTKNEVIQSNVEVTQQKYNRTSNIELSKQPITPQGWSKYLLYLLSGIIPIVGLILGIIYLLKPEKECKTFGLKCLLFGIFVIPVIAIIVSLAVTYIFKPDSSVTPFIYSIK